MGWSDQRGKPPSIRITRRMAALVILAGILLMLLWLGIKIGRAYQAAQDGMAHLEALQESLGRPPQDLLDDFAALKEQVQALDNDMQTLRAETSTFDPLLAHLGWVPQYGPELVATPHLTAMAADISGAAVDLSGVMEVLLPAIQEGGENDLSRIVTLLREQRPLLQQAYAHLQHAAYERTLVDPAQLDDGPFARAGSLLEQFDANLPTLVRALALLNDLLPQADTLLGMDAPRRYLLLGQNNFELRATGGFAGSMGPLTVDKGRITSLDYRRSYEWDNPNREKVQPPFPYVRYMSFGAWFIRDANWYADFPSSAQTIESFWQLDGHEPVEGVIAVDLRAVQNLLEAIGPVEVPGYGVSVGGSTMLETIWDAYRRDPGFLPALTNAVAEQLQRPDVLRPARLPALLQALEHSLEEKHILLYFNDPALQGAMVRTGWSGAIRDDAGDYLMVVDSDFSYAEVNPYIEEEVGYYVTLDHNLKVLTSTVTLSYWNHFDQWSSAETRERFGGLCFDPAAQELKPIPGCYGDYIRLYVPRGSRFIQAEGFDDGMEYREEAGRTVIAGYVRVLPGEQRTASVTYLPPAGPVGGQYRLTLQKQPGTDAIPLVVEVHVVGSAPAETGLNTDLGKDRVVTAVFEQGQLVLGGSGTALARLDPQERARQQAFAEGLTSWEAGRQDEALARWRAAAVPDLVLERANLLLTRGNLEGAEALARAALEIAPESAQAYFTLGRVLQQAGDDAGAIQAWERSVALDPGNRAARLELGLLYEDQGDAEQAVGNLQQADPEEADRVLWQRARGHFNNGESEAGLDTLRLLIRAVPSDGAARLAIGWELTRQQRYDEAMAAFEEAHRAVPGDVGFYIGRGYLYSIQNQGGLALADLETAVAVAPRSADAWYYLGLFRWQFGKDTSGAIAAMEQAVALRPEFGSVLGNFYWAAGEHEAAISAYEHAANLSDCTSYDWWSLGNAYRDTGRLQEAVAAYERAIALPGSNAYTWWSLGGAYQLQEQWDEAISAYTEAVTRDPANADFHGALAYAYEQAGQKEKAIAEYEAALAIRPGQAEWLEALERLGQ
jgi:tetratricopeptide (TPR) repeat protein